MTVAAIGTLVINRDVTLHEVRAANGQLFVCHKVAGCATLQKGNVVTLDYMAEEFVQGAGTVKNFVTKVDRQVNAER